MRADGLRQLGASGSLVSKWDGYLGHRWRRELAETYFRKHAVLAFKSMGLTYVGGDFTSWRSSGSHLARGTARHGLISGGR